MQVNHPSLLEAVAVTACLLLSLAAGFVVMEWLYVHAELFQDDFAAIRSLLLPLLTATTPLTAASAAPTVVAGIIQRRKRLAHSLASVLAAALCVAVGAAFSVSRLRADESRFMRQVMAADLTLEAGHGFVYRPRRGYTESQSLLMFHPQYGFYATSN